jgi:hypothetical protein
MINKVSTLA